MIGKDFIQKYPPGQASANTVPVKFDIPAIDPSTTNDPRLTTNDHQMNSQYSSSSPLFLMERGFSGEVGMTMNDNSTSDIESLIQQIESSQIDITSTYDSWLRILFALSEHLGESGREYAHKISRFHPGYKASDCDKQFNYCLRANKSGITIRTLFYIAQQHGLISSPAPSGAGFSNLGWHDEFSLCLPSSSNPQIPASSNSQSFRSPLSDIQHPTSEVLPFPVHIFPPPVADLISAAAKSIGCPPDFIAIPVLAVLATAIGNSRHIQVKKDGPKRQASTQQ